MQLVFLHGPPAAGKLTIATELAALGIGQVFDNHLTMDVARPFFPFGSRAFWDLARELRLTCLRAGAAHGAGTILYTCCYDHPADLPLFETIEEIVGGSGGAVHPVYLACSTAELERRVTDPARAARRKLHSVDGLRAQLAAWNCVPVPRDTCMTIVTEGRTPAECAREIAARL